MTTDTPVFEPFPKIARLSRECVITEKLDGTNAQVIIRLSMDTDPMAIASKLDETRFGGWLHMYAGSRTRLITPADDNYGFAQWVHSHVEELWALGVGRHFGEWWGQKIQRGYGLTEKRFSLFNATRWCAYDAEPQCINENDPNPKCILKYQDRAPRCCSIVPVLYRGLFDTNEINFTLKALKLGGSVAAPDFMQPEGIVIFHTAGSFMFKKTIEKDEQPKGFHS